jgi:Ras-related protein Rab-18
MAMETQDYLFKMLIIGDSGVGKSSILLRFCDDEFNEKQASTIGVDFKTKMMQVKEKKLKLALWDTAGQERFRTLTSSYYRGAQGIILVYDCSSRATFEHVRFWQEEVRKYSTNQDAILMLIANKVDLANAEVTRQEGEEFAFANSMMFIETSAKTRQGIKQAFEEVVYKILDTPSLLQSTQPVGMRQTPNTQKAAEGCAC